MSLWISRTALVSWSGEACWVSCRRSTCGRVSTGPALAPFRTRTRASDELGEAMARLQARCKPVVAGAKGRWRLVSEVNRSSRVFRTPPSHRWVFRCPKRRAQRWLEVEGRGRAGLTCDSWEHIGIAEPSPLSPSQGLVTPTDLSERQTRETRKSVFVRSTSVHRFKPKFCAALAATQPAAVSAGQTCTFRLIESK